MFGSIVGGTSHNIIIVSKFLQEENTLPPIKVTLLGIEIDVRREQFSNALFPIEVTLLGIVIDVRVEQKENAELPIEVTL